jgi:hypothetical protein
MRPKKLTDEERKERRKIYLKEYRKLKSDEIKKSKTEWRLNNKDKVKIHGEKYREKYKDEIRERKRIYVEKKRKTDELFKLKENVRNLINASFLYKSHKKNTKTVDILGLNIDDFKIYLESQFQDWMSWDNYGLYNGEPNYGWDIDHIIPLKTVTTEEDLI